MTKCLLRIPCSECPERAHCPREVRRDKRARRPMADNVSYAPLKKAAAVLADGWYTCERLGCTLYGIRPENRTQRMAVMVRARRPVNKLHKLGLLAVRVTGKRNGQTVREYTLTEEGREAFGC